MGSGKSVWGVFLYLYWSFFDFVSIRELFGMARGDVVPLGVDSGLRRFGVGQGSP